MSMGDSRQLYSYPCVRRKSIFNRITDSISSLLPTGLFEGTVVSDRTSLQPDIHRCPPVASAITQIDRVQPCSTSNIPRYSSGDAEKVVSEQNVDDVDLDAKDDASTCSNLSRNSVSTSGVSSLLPHGNRSGRRVYERMNFESASAVQNTRERYSSRCESEIGRSSRYNSTNNLFSTWTSVDPLPRALSVHSHVGSKRLKLDRTASSTVSSFYNTRTTYGGAASSRQRQNYFSLPVVPYKFVVDEVDDVSVAGKRKRSAANVMLSTTARHILESLEKHASPISSTDRIPVPMTLTVNQPPILAASIRAQSFRYPPYLTAFKRFKSAHSRLFNNNETPTTSNVCTIRTSPSVKPDPTQRLSPAPLRVPISLGSDCSFSTSALTNLNQPGQSSGIFFSDPAQSSLETSAAVNFTFADPITLSTPQHRRFNGKPKPVFTFRSPLRQPSKTPNSRQQSSILTQILKSAPGEASSMIGHQNPNVNKTTAYSASLHGWRCESCLVENATERTACKECCMPKLQHFEDKATAKDKIVTSIKRNCLRCGTENSSSDTMCNKCLLSCTPEHQFASTSNGLWKILPSVSETFTSFFSPEKTVTTTSIVNNALVTTDWECLACMANNKDAVSCCVCCGTARPKAVSSYNLSFPSTASVDKWECPTCMDNVSKCVCCQTQKPESKLHRIPGPVSSFSTSNVLNTSGCGKWECPTCMVDNNLDLNECVCCQTKNPNVVSVASVKNTYPTRESSKSGFTFSCTNSTMASAAPTFTFGASATTSTSQKPTLVTSLVSSCPTMNHNTLIATAKSVPTFTFSSTTSSGTKPHFDFGVSHSSTAGGARQMASNTFEAGSLGHSASTVSSAPNEQLVCEVKPLTSLQELGNSSGSNLFCNGAAATLPIVEENSFETRASLPNAVSNVSFTFAAPSTLNTVASNSFFRFGLPIPLTAASSYSTKLQPRTSLSQKRSADVHFPVSLCSSSKLHEATTLSNPVSAGTFGEASNSKSIFSFGLPQTSLADSTVASSTLFSSANLCSVTSESKSANRVVADGRIIRRAFRRNQTQRT